MSESKTKGNVIFALGIFLSIFIVFMVIGNLYIQNSLLQNRQIALKNQVSSLESEVIMLRQNCDDLESQYNASEAQYNINYQMGYDAGYQKGVEDGAGKGYNIREPTYIEAMDFISLDQTDKNTYDEESYCCFHFTRDFKSSAFDVGYRCGFVYIEFSDGAHAIVCFNTVDEGLIFIEPQTDEIVNVTIGEIYVTIDFWVGTIQSYTIIW